MEQIIIPILILLFFIYLIWNYRFQKENSKSDLSGNLDKKREDYDGTFLGVFEKIKKEFKKSSEDLDA